MSPGARRPRLAGVSLAVPRAMAVSAAVALVSLASPISLGAQERDRGGSNLGFDPGGYQQFNTNYTGHFTFVRLMYRTSPRRAYRNPGWAHDYPVAERNFGKILSELTTMTPWLGGSNVLAMDDPELFKYPVAYLSEPGDWELSQEEAETLRAYILKGGFLIIDDMSGPWHFENTVRMLQYALPDLRVVEIPIEHPIFDSFFHLEEEAIHSLGPSSGGRFRGGGGPARASYWGIFEDNDLEDGRLMVVINHDNDIGDYMEWSDSGFVPIALSNEAYKLGVNYVVYAFTH
ncbi:MAG: DUF4159 domain-containing protein [Gemmatimonadota bacterium]|nr:DUF4159 domain-containing protein [Gemmatimonadota bacterium]